MQERTKIALRWTGIGVIVGVVALALLMHIRERKASGVGMLSSEPPAYCHDVTVRFSTNSAVAAHGAFPDPFVICKKNTVTFMPNETEKIVYFKVDFSNGKKTPFPDEYGKDKYEFHSPDPLPASCHPSDQAAPPVSTNPAKGPCFLCSSELFEYSLDFCSVDATGKASKGHFDPGGIVMK